MSQRLLLFLSVLAFLLLCFLCMRQHGEETASVEPSKTEQGGVPQGPKVEGRTERGTIVLAGTAASEDAKSSLAGRARTLYGTERVRDEMKVDTSLARPAWGPGFANIVSMLGGRTQGASFVLAQDSVTLRGEVQGDDAKASIVKSVAEAVGSQIRVVDALHVLPVSAEQAGVDNFLKGKVIEFATASAVIAPKGRQILDQLVPLLAKAGNRPVEISGHTDNEGDEVQNVTLSNDRARAVKQYLTGKGIAADSLTTVGHGSSKPVASNATAEGRRQNRRIEFAIQ